MEIGILLFDRVTALDAVGPYEVLSRIPGARVRWVASEPGPKRSDAGLALVADAPIREVPAPEVVLVPGGPGVRAAMGDTEILDWLRSVHRRARWTTSVCTGALVLGAAGLLRGRRATTYWAELEALRELGAEPVRERFVLDGEIATAAGVSAGIDMALRLAAELAGDTVARAVQLGIEYDPAPPFDAGSPETAGPELVELVRAALSKAPQA